MSRQVDLLLVNPGNRLEQFASLNELATVAQPLGIAMVAAYARRHGISVAIIDAEAQFWTPDQTIGAIKEYDPVLVGLTAFTTKMTAAEQTMRLVKEWREDVRTLIGGHHASAIPGPTSLAWHVDYVLAGEGYDAVVGLVDALKRGDTAPAIDGIWYSNVTGRDMDPDGPGVKVHDGGLASYTRDLDLLPGPAWDLLPMGSYRAHHWQGWGHEGPDLSKFGIIYTSLGCPFQCDYCSVNLVYGKRLVRYLSPERVADEIERLVGNHGVKFIELIDDTFTVNAKRVHQVCDAIIARGLGEEVEMWCFSRTDRADPALLKKMRKAGINWVFMGLESGTDEVLMGVNKKQTVRQIKEACQKVWDAGIYIGGNYMFGLRNDTFDTMRATLDLAMDLRTEYANFFVMMAYPGTSYYKMAQDRGYPLPDSWGQFGFFAPDAVPLRNDHLSCEEILSFRDQAFVTYFTDAGYQSVVKERFGQGTVDFINGKILSRKLVRSRPAMARS